MKRSFALTRAAVSAGVCLFGCLSTNINPQNLVEIFSIPVSKRLLILLAVAFVALAVLGNFDKRQWKAIRLAGIGGLFGIYLFSNSSLVLSYLLPECIAVALFFAIDSALRKPLPFRELPFFGRYKAR